MKKLLQCSLSLWLVIFSVKAHALVDYSETNATPSSAIKTMTKTTSSSEAKGLIWKSDISMAANYESAEYQSKQIGLINLNTHLQTPFNVYMDLTYWHAQSKTTSGSGNSKVLLGFNWLRFGSASDEARFDFYGGARFSGKSELASSRTDKIFGVETTKRFGTFGLGLGYDYTMVGRPAKQSDMSIGNIHRISVSGGWMVSNDIQFELEMESFKVSESSSGHGANDLSKSISFSTLSPKLNLTIVPSVTLELGARFRTNKAKSDQDLSSAKLIDLHGAYSNSLFTGISFNI
jgi:hypothetical protein